jgi:hypothetical protein
LGQEVFKEGQWIEKHTLGNIEQIAPVEVHWYGVGFVDANNLHQVFRGIRQHRATRFETMNDLGEFMGGRRQNWLFGGFDHCD